jgi:hypothetical protein
MTMVSERIARPLGVVLLAAFLSPTLAFAQGVQATEEARATARQLMDEGREARNDKKDYKAALDAFRKAHSIMKVPSTGIEVARTLDAMGLFVEAAEAAQEVIDMPPVITPPKKKEVDAFIRARSEAQTLLDEAKKKIGFIKITIKGAKPEAVEVTINDLAVAPATLKDPVKQNPGKHTVVAKGPKTATAEVEVSSGQTQEITLDVTKAEKPKVEAPPPEAPPPPPPKSAFLRPMPLIGFGIAGVGLIAGSVTGALTMSRASSIKESCEGNRCPSSKQGDIDSAKTLGLISTISFGVAGVGAAIGVIGLLRKPKTEETGKVQVSPWIGLNSAGVVGQF